MGVGVLAWVCGCVLKELFAAEKGAERQTCRYSSRKIEREKTTPSYIVSPPIPLTINDSHSAKCEEFDGDIFW